MSQLESETPGPDKWQINVLYDVEKTSTLLLTVTKDCCTEELFQKLREHPKFPRITDFQLYSISGTARSSLEESPETHLSEYGITDRSSLALVARFDGGVWPTVVDVEAEPRQLSPAEGITLTTISPEHPDVLGVEDDGPGVIMRCGHATAPMALARYCHSELEKGKDEIRCPICDNKWKFALLKPAACLTANEITEFEKRAHINFFKNHQTEMNPCPQCSIFSRPRSAQDKRVVCENCTSSSGKIFEFCWTCLGEWKTLDNETCGNPDCGSKKGLFEILANCDTKKLNSVEVPSKRSCPNCSIIIDHKDGCKHMTCRRCNYQFCFICLKKRPCGTGDFEPCDVAPRQTSDTNFIGATIEAEKQLPFHLSRIRQLFEEMSTAEQDEASVFEMLLARLERLASEENAANVVNDADDIDISRLPRNNEFAQPRRTLETNDVPASSSTGTSRPENTRRSCSIL